MASSFSSDLKLELMVTGENAGTWGDKTNNNLNLVQQAISGVEAVTLSSGGTVALVMSDGAISNARNLVIKFATATIAASTVCTVPDGIEKFYIFDCSGLTNANNLTIKTVSGTGFSPTTAGAASPKIFAAYSDGTNLTEISLNTLGGTIGTAQIEADAVDNAQIADDAIRAAQISNNAVVTAGINDDAVTQDKIADDAVGADQLANTTVTAGSYTSASITVDAQGRLTAASSGSAGGGGFVPKLNESGPASGTYTASSNASSILCYATGGGGGQGGTHPRGGRGGAGGNGMVAVYSIPVSNPFSQPFTVGAHGNGPSPQPPTNQGFASNANAGGATSLGSLFTVNGGNGGNAGFNSPAPGPGAGSGNHGNDGTASSSPVAALFSSAEGNLMTIGGNNFFGRGANSSGFPLPTSSNPKNKGQAKLSSDETPGDGLLVIYENIGA